MNYYKTTDSKFYNEYHSAATLDKSGIHHSGIKGVIKNTVTGAPIYGASITGEGKETKTDKFGAYELVKIRSGLRTFTIAAPGYEPQVVDIAIIRGKILSLNIELVAKLITLTATA